jgi:hypothetical protein
MQQLALTPIARTHIQALLSEEEEELQQEEEQQLQSLWKQSVKLIWRAIPLQLPTPGALFSTASSTKASPITTLTPQAQSGNATICTTLTPPGKSAPKRLMRSTCAPRTPGRPTHSFSPTAARTGLLSPRHARVEKTSNRGRKLDPVMA